VAELEAAAALPPAAPPTPVDSAMFAALCGASPLQVNVLLNAAAAAAAVKHHVWPVLI